MRATAAALLVLLAAVALPPAALAQQPSPLSGQGQPSNATQEIFMSVYLDRLLAGQAGRRWGSSLVASCRRAPAAAAAAAA